MLDVIKYLRLSKHRQMRLFEPLDLSKGRDRTHHLIQLLHSATDVWIVLAHCQLSHSMHNALELEIIGRLRRLE